MKPQPRYQPGDRIGGRYQVHKALMGGMGEVYLCLDLEEMYPYALKTFQQRYLTNPQLLRRAFEKEVATWVALEKHPNIVRCFYMTTFNNQPFMVLEWIAGEEGRGTDLRSWLRRGPLDLKLALEIALDICYGLLHAQAKHPEQRFVHRDLKPENILMAQGGLAKITDFGLAQIVKAAGLETGLESAVTDSRHSFSAGQGIAGTPAYMALEQWRGEPLDVRTDIYALGCILYELLTGASPFRVDFTPTTPQQVQSWLATMQQAHETIHVPLLPAPFGPELHDLVAVCMAKTRHDRPASLRDLISRITDLYQAQWPQALPQRSAPIDFTATDYNNRGITYHALGQHAQALVDFGRALELNPTSAQVYSSRGNTYRALGQHAQALADFGRALGLDPTFAQAYSNRGITYEALGQHDQALTDFDHALELDPTFAQAYSNRGITYETLGQYAQALADHGRALELDPTLAKAHYNRGNIHYALRQYEQALVDYRRALDFDPTDAQAYVNRGNTLAALQQYQQALADYEQALDLDPTDAEAYVNRGKTHAVLQQHDRALADFGRAIDLDPALAQAYGNRGKTYYTMQQFERALADYERAIDLDPTSVQAYVNRGVAHAVLQQYERALTDFGRAIDLDPTFVQAYVNRGNTHAALRRYEQALTDFGRAIDLDPTFADAYFNLGAIFANRGQLREALPYLEKAAHLGFQQGAQAVAQVRRRLGLEAAPRINQTQQALAIIQQAASLETLQQAVTRFPSLVQPDFISALEQAIAQRVPVEQQPIWQQKLGWLRQLATTR